MKKGITPIIGVLIAVTITIVVSGAFFYWATNIQRGAQGNSQLATKNFLAQTLLRGGELIDSYYTTIEEKDVLAYSDFKTNFCNSGQASLDMTGTKSIQLEEESSGNIVCAEDVLTNECLETTSYIIGGLSGAGSTSTSDVPAAIVYSDDSGSSWNEAAGLGTDTNVEDVSSYAVDTGGESPTDFWAIDSKAHLVWSEDLSYWPADKSIRGYSLATYGTGNVFFIGEGTATTESGGQISRVSFDTSSGTTDVSRAVIVDETTLTSGGVKDYDGIFSLYTDSDTSALIAGSGSSAGDGDTALGLIYFSSDSSWSNIATATIPDNYVAIHNFASTLSKIYASASRESYIAMGGDTISYTSDIIYSTDSGGSWTSAGFKTQVGDVSSVTVVIDDPAEDGDSIYVGYNDVGTAYIRRYDKPTDTWGSVLKSWPNAKINDLVANRAETRFYAAIGNTTSGSEEAEIWQSGSSWDATTWTKVYSNPHRAETTTLEPITKCTKQNPVCVSGCDSVLQPGECTDLQIALEGSACDISSYSPETEFKLTFNLGNFFSKVFHFSKAQNPADLSLPETQYSAAASPPAGPLTLNEVILNSTDPTTNDTIENLTAYLNISNADYYTFTKIYDWRVNYTSIAVLNMPFDNQSTSFVKDYSTSGNNGTATGITWNNAATCKLNATSGGCYYFDGSTSYILVPDDPGLNNGNLTIEVWVNLTDTTTSRDNTIIGKRDITNADNGVYYLHVSEQNTDGLVRFTTYDNTCIGGGTHRTLLTGTTNVQDKKWHYIVATVNDSHQAIYVDGTLDNSQAYTSGICTSRSDDLYIGAKGHHINDFFKGYMDNVKIYNRTLSANQIALNYNLGSPRYNLTHNNETCGGDQWFVATTLSESTSDKPTVLSNGVNITGNACSSGGGVTCALDSLCNFDCGGTGYSSGGTCYYDSACTNPCPIGG